MNVLEQHRCNVVAALTGEHRQFHRSAQPRLLGLFVYCLPQLQRQPFALDVHPRSLRHFDRVGADPSPGHGLDEHVSQQRAHRPGHLRFSFFGHACQVVGHIHRCDVLYPLRTKDRIKAVDPHANIFVATGRQLALGK
ncbi:hypothetical protein D3C76_1304660 [compost metagenome]